MEIIVIPLLTLVVFLLLFVILIFLLFAFDVFLELPYVATQRQKIKTIIKFASIKRGQTVIDLGSGDGRLLLAATQKGAHAIGYEINPLLIILTLVHASLKGFANQIEVKRKNLWQADLAVADVIFVYGRKKNMKDFENFVYQNAKNGTRIVVNTNPFPAKKPTKTENGIFLYTI